MPVVVIDTIKPKNNLTFPIVEDVDVLIKTSGARLSEVVANMATAEQIAALQTAIAGKASIESVEALTSLVNTKADAEDLTALSATVEGKADVTDLEALQADVADKADTADLTALETEVDSKADSSALTTATANLQAQIDNIVTPVTQDAEVQNARVGADGESYSTLKERLDANQAVADAANDAAFVRTYSDSNFVLKHIGVNGKLNDNNNKNITFENIVPALKGSTVYVDSGYKFQVGLYNITTQAFIERILWMTEPYILTGDYGIRLEISDTEESVLSDDSIKSHLHYTLVATEMAVNEVLTSYENQQISFISDGNINLNYDIGTTINLTPEVSATYAYAIVDCTENDVFIITATGGNNPRVWGFVDADNKLLAKADTLYPVTNLELIAPHNAAKLILNCQTSATCDCKKAGIKLTDKVFENKIQNTQSRVTTIETDINDKEIAVNTVGNIRLSYPVGTQINLTPESVDSYRYAITECNEYDIFKINATGGENPRVWGFVDENNILLSVAAASTAGMAQTDLIIYAPPTAKKLIINSQATAVGDCRNLGNNKYDRVLAHNIQENSQKIDVLETEISELETEISELDLDEVLDQTNNIVAALGIDTFRGKTVETAAPEKYKAWPFVGKVGDKAICVYSIGLAHEDNTTPDIYCKLSKNGVIWSPEKKIISTSIRDTVTGKGYDDNGDFVFWVRKGSPGGENTVHDLYKTSDGYTFELVASPTFEKVPSHIGDIVNVPNVGMFAFWNDAKAAGSRSWGYVKSTDNGETWAQTVVETDLQIYECPMEMSPVYLGDGKILVMGRQESTSSYGMFQIQSKDYGDTWEKGSTNITDIVLSTPSVLYNNGTLSLYYFQREVGALRLRTTSPETIWDNPTSWSDSIIIAHGTTSGQDTGNVNACQFGNIQIASFYSGDSTNTGIYATIM